MQEGFKKQTFLLIEYQEEEEDNYSSNNMKIQLNKLKYNITTIIITFSSFSHDSIYLSWDSINEIFVCLFVFSLKHLYINTPCQCPFYVEHFLRCFQFDFQYNYHYYYQLDSASNLCNDYSSIIKTFHRV